jgi:transposase
MAGVYKLAITETEADLKQRLRHAKTASDQERLQLLYLLQSGQAKTVQDAATLLARHRITVQKWLQLYRSGGLEALLAHTPRTGRRQSIPQWAQTALNKQLHESAGFNSYGEICQWLETQLGITAPYKTVHQLVHYRLKASPKVARPMSTETSLVKAEAYKKTR